MSGSPGQRIVFLCTGNICRSPLAEFLARQKFAGMVLSFASAGLDALLGQPASRHAVGWAGAWGAELSGHVSQAVSASLVADAAWVIGMTRSHAAIFRSRWGRVHPGAIGVLGAPGVDLTARVHSPGGIVEVADPDGQDLAAYTACGELIDHLLGGWAATFATVSRAQRRESGGKESR